MSEIARSSSGLALPPAATETGLDLPKGMPLEQWQETGEKLGEIDRACRWWIGDWLKYGESEYGKPYASAAVATGYSEQTLMDAVWVAGKVPKSRRVKRLSFSHHKVVAKLKPAEQERHLADAARNGWSVAELRKRIKGEAVTESSSSPESIAAPADPPELAPGGEEQPIRRPEMRAATALASVDRPTPDPGSGADSNDLVALAEDCRQRTLTTGLPLVADVGSAVLAVGTETAEACRAAISDYRDQLDQAVVEIYEALRAADVEREEAARLGIEVKGP